MIDEFILQKLLKTSANPKAAKKKKKAAEKVLEKLLLPMRNWSTVFFQAVSDETAGEEAAPTLVEQ